MKQTCSGRGRLMWGSLALALSLTLTACGARPGSAAPQPASQAAQPTTRPIAQVAQPAKPPAAEAAPAQQPAPSEQAAPTLPPAAATAETAGLPVEPPQCAPGSDSTPAQTEGPYYKANPPERSSLLDPNVAGTKLTVTGYVLTRDCSPVANARVDFWQADDAGDYDNSGYTLRGYQLTDDTGRYTVETVIPGLYPGRTRHIHVKVQAPNGPVLTTQLYFPDEKQNGRDSIFDPRLVLAIQDAPDGKAAAFDFILPGS